MSIFATGMNASSARMNFNILAMTLIGSDFQRDGVAHQMNDGGWRDSEPDTETSNVSAFYQVLLSISESMVNMVGSYVGFCRDSGGIPFNPSGPVLQQYVV